MPTRHRLDNGLTLLHEHQGAAHVVAWQIWVDVGGADESPDEAGLAHLHEHMLFKGTERRGPGRLPGTSRRTAARSMPGPRGTTPSTTR